MSSSVRDDLPVGRVVDVLVVGGGPAGVAAAFAAARMGAETLIVEQFNCLGGIATAGGHGHICLYSSWGTKERVVGGVPWEMALRVTEAGYGTYTTSKCDFEVEGMKLVLEEMASEAGCGLLYYTMFCESVVEDGRVTGAVVQNKSGRSVIGAKRVIDCTARPPSSIGRPMPRRTFPPLLDLAVIFVVSGELTASFAVVPSATVIVGDLPDEYSRVPQSSVAR